MSNPLNEMNKLIIDSIHSNSEFLYSQTKEVLEEIIELINDAIDLLQTIFTKLGKDPTELTSKAFVFYVFHVLLPMSYGIYTSLMTGNLPACFMMLRFLLESLAKCYYADVMFQDTMSALDKIQSVESSLNNKKISISKLLSCLEEELGMANNVMQSL